MKILLAGANGGVAKALAAQLHSNGHQIFSISRKPSGKSESNSLKLDTSKQESVSVIQDWLSQIELVPDCVIQCAGLLHDRARVPAKMPEKLLSQLDDEWLIKSIQVNLLSHIHLAQAVNPLIKKSSPLNWVSLSALVGSISDNQLGGWYSYRISKAALNMFIRNLDIEWRRKSPQSVVVALHPGTTDTGLSEPFQANIADGKLYDPGQTALRLTQVIENLSTEQSGHLLHWDGKIVSF